MSARVLTTRRELLLAGAALGAALAGRQAVAAPAKVRRAGAAPRLTPLSEQCRFRRASDAEWEAIRRELEEKGWSGGQVAHIATSFQPVGTELRPFGMQEATLFGDVDGDGRPEWVIGLYYPPDTLGGLHAVTPLAPASGRTATSGQDDRARIVILRPEKGGRCRGVWRSPGLGYRFGPAVYNLQEVNQDLDSADSLRLPLALTDVDGDG